MSFLSNFTAAFQFQRKYNLLEQLLQDFGFQMTCSDFYKPMISDEFALHMTGHMQKDHFLQIAKITSCYGRLEPQRLICYAFNTQWEVSIPQRNLVYNGDVKQLLFQVDGAKMSYSSWKFHWLYHSQSTIVLRTSSSTSTKVSMLTGIVMTPMHVLQLAKRLAPSIPAELLSAKCTMITLDVLQMELECKTQHLSLVWNDKLDTLVIKYGALELVPKYDASRKLLAQFAYSDILFEFL